MGKIIKLNENDLKRIVTKVLNERRQLNEDDEDNTTNNGLAPGAITQDVADQLKYTENEADPISRFQAICDVCISGKEGLGPLTQSESALDGIAEKIYEAIEESDWYSFGAGTNEKKVASGIRSTKSFPDFCHMINTYSSKYEDFYESMDGDFDKEYEQRTYLVSPVVDVIKFSTKIVGKKSSDIVKTDDEKTKDEKTKDVVGGGGEEDNWNRFLCVVEHPKAIADKFDGGKRTRFIIGSTYYMGNGKKIRRGVELDYSCDDPEFEGIEFVKDEDPTHGGKGKGKTDINAEVTDIQGFLTEEGYDISNDGKIGPETTGAIIDYIVDGKTGSDSFKPSSVLELQKKINRCYSKKIKEDGKVGPETLDAIADALESAQQGDLCS
jgi:hypothetical protein